VLVKISAKKTREPAILQVDFFFISVLSPKSGVRAIAKIREKRNLFFREN
jgi:hypothetical protein